MTTSVYIREKAIRLLAEGRVRISCTDDGTLSALVQGDHDFYPVCPEVHGWRCTLRRTDETLQPCPGRREGGPAVSVDLVRADLLASLEKAGWITSTALVIDDPDLPIERFEALGVQLGKVGSAVKFWQGDYLAYAEHLFGEWAAQLSEALNLSAEGRQECLRVALAVPRSKRRPALSWWHHRQVAAKWITPLQREELLDRAEQERLTTRELEAIIRDLRALGSDSRGATAECDDVVDQAAAELRRLLLDCGYPSDLAVSIEIAAPGVTFTTRTSAT